MASLYSSKSSRQNITSKHSGSVDLSWEGPSMNTRSKNTSHSLHHSTKNKKSASPMPSNYVSKSVSQCSNKPPPTSSVVPNPSHHSSSTGMGEASNYTSLPQSGITQLLEPDVKWWCEIKKEFPKLADYFQEMQLDKELPQLLTNLFKLNQLPFSPYSQLMCKLRPTMERYVHNLFQDLTLATIQ